jgi:hypothetical protein
MVVCLQVAADAAANFGTKTTASLLIGSFQLIYILALHESIFRKHIVSPISNSVDTNQID